MTEITAYHTMTIIVTVVALAVVAVAAVITALFHTLNAKHEAFKSNLTAHQEATQTQMESIQTAVAKGIEEHKVLHAALDKTNTRLDQLMMHLLERKT